MLPVIFMWKATDIVALNFLPRTSELYKEKAFSLYFLKRLQLDGNLKNNAVILFSRKLSK